ncbi:MAG: hypothetical protein JSU00_31330 [Acidobacteria bacterium]|nr:hypothetical protein [Acidobacteriota bacterium]
MIQLAKRALRWLTGRAQDPPGDPYASVRQPVRRPPSSRGAATAVEEPNEPTRLSLFGWRSTSR